MYCCFLMTTHERRDESHSHPHGRTSPPLVEDRSAQLRPVEIHRSTLSDSLTAPSRSGRAGGSDHTAPAGDHRRRRGAPTPTAERTIRTRSLAAPSPSCSPTQPNPTHSSLPQLHLPPRATARRELDEELPPLPARALPSRPRPHVGSAPVPAARLAFSRFAGSS
jgi:hypothetical protein